MRLIDADALKEEVNKKKVVGRFNMLLLIDNALTVDNTPIVEQFTIKERPADDWGEWIISEIRCPNCLEFYNTDCFAKDELDRCPNCKTKMKGGEEE